MTPRQTCLQPDGFRRNLRSKTRWFTGFCNSHQVSHFATFFIDARAEISVAESHLVIQKMCKPTPPVDGQGHACTNSFHYPWRDLRRGSLFDKQTNTSLESSMHVCSQGIATGEALGQTDAFPILYEQVHEFSRCQVLTMILPQVHLRKPCYDFSFL